MDFCTFLARRSILLDTQHPDGLEKIRELEAQGHPARLEVEEPPLTPPRFVSELRVFIITKNYVSNKKRLHKTLTNGLFFF